MPADSFKQADEVKVDLQSSPSEQIKHYVLITDWNFEAILLGVFSKREFAEASKENIIKHMYEKDQREFSGGFEKYKEDCEDYFSIEEYNINPSLEEMLEKLIEKE